MKAMFDWIDDRSGLLTGVRKYLDASQVGEPSWKRVWPCTILFTFVVQALTGVFLWMYYSPSAQTAWESVYFLQHEVVGGWLLRAVHHYSAQVMLVLIGIYLLQLIITGACRAPREFVYWVTVLMGIFCLGLMLTGDLLAWDQNSYASTKVRVSFLTLLPGIGPALYKLAAGGPDFGHLTLTRFVTLHIGVCTAGMLGLLILHSVFARRAESAEVASADKTTKVWPDQALRNAVASGLVLIVIVILALSHGVSGDQRGVALGAPSDPGVTYSAARPEWAFLGLYGFSNMFSGESKILPIFVYPTLLMCVVFAMPFIGRVQVGHYFNVGFTAFILLALVVLSWISVAHDLGDPAHQIALSVGREDAARTKTLARRPEGIPPTGARILLQEDPKTQGPRLYKSHCAKCHDYARIVQIELQAKGGTLTLAKTDGLGFQAGDGKRDAAMTIIGKPSQINLALDGLTFNAKSGPGSVTISVEAPSHAIDREMLHARRTVSIKSSSGKGDTPEHAKDVSSSVLEISVPSEQKGDKALVFSTKKGNAISINDTEAPLRDVLAEHPSAPNLFGYGSRNWVAGWLNPTMITGPNYFGGTTFHKGKMVDAIEQAEKDADEFTREDFAILVTVLSAEAQLASQKDQDAADKELIEESRSLLSDYGCLDCHRFHDEGPLGKGTDLTGYASRQWTVGFIADPTHKRFYGDKNDRMPVYAGFPDDPAKNVLRAEEIEVLTDWLLGQWYEPPKQP